MFVRQSYIGCIAMAILWLVHGIVAQEQTGLAGGALDPAAEDRLDADSLAVRADQVEPVAIDGGAATAPDTMGGALEPLSANAAVAGDSAKARDRGMVDLDRLVVTATRTKRLVSETPASVSVVSRAEIEASPAKNIDDLLATKTGVRMRRVVGIGEGIPSDIIMRGIPGCLAASRTLVLVDGIPTNASGTPFLILNVIPVDAVGRIEVVRGPHSSLYGANAFGGVVNVLSLDGDGRPGGTVSLETALPFNIAHEYVAIGRAGNDAVRTGASDSYYNVCGTSEGGSERLSYLGSVGFRTIGNYLLSDSGFVRTPDTAYFKNNRNFDYRDFRVFAKGTWRAGDRLSTTLHARYFNSDLGFGETKNVWPDPVLKTDSIRALYHLADDSVDVVTLGEVVLVGPSIQFAVTDNLDISAATFYRRVNGEFYNEGLDTVGAPPDTFALYVPSYWKSAANDWQIQAQLVARAGESHVITAGFEYLLNTIDFGASIDPTRGDTLLNSHGAEEKISNAGVYVQDEIGLADRLNIVPGVRFDFHSDFGGALSPKLGVSYRLIDEVQLRGSIGRAFRAPSLSELYMPDLTIKKEFVLSPNPDLKPEYVWAFDGGVEVRPAGNLNLSVGGYHNWLRDLIVPSLAIDDVGTLLSEGGKVTQKNSNEAWSWGLEFSMEWQALEWLNVWGNYVFQQSRDVTASKVRKMFVDAGRFPDGTEWRVPLDYLPANSANLGVRFAKTAGNVLIEGSVNEAYVGDRQFLEFAGLKPDTVHIDEQFWIEGENGRLVLKELNPPLVTLDAYWRTDVSLSATFRERFVTEVSIQNLFAADFEESMGTKAPGRFASLKFGLKF